MSPKGVLIDYGGTLLEEVSFDPAIGGKWLFEQAILRPKNVTLEMVLDRLATTARHSGRRPKQL